MKIEVKGGKLTSDFTLTQSQIYDECNSFKSLDWMEVMSRFLLRFGVTREQLEKMYRDEKRKRKLLKIEENG